jgi:hypothetical protein
MRYRVRMVRGGECVPYTRRGSHGVRIQGSEIASQMLSISLVAIRRKGAESP